MEQEKKILPRDFFNAEEFSSREEFDRLLFKNLLRVFKETDYEITMNAYHLTNDAEKFIKALFQLKEFTEFVDKAFSDKNKIGPWEALEILDDYFWDGPSEEDRAKMKAYIESLN